MTTNKHAKIEISIAGERIFLTVPFEKQDSVRDCEYEINSLFDKWRREFPRKTNSELLAMIAYQYASFFREISRKYAALADNLSKTLISLDALNEPDDSTCSRPELTD